MRKRRSFSGSIIREGSINVYTDGSISLRPDSQEATISSGVELRVGEKYRLESRTAKTLKSWSFIILEEEHRNGDHCYKYLVDIKSNSNLKM
jgi:hypothetical protein